MTCRQFPGGGTALNILKMQFILQTNYDKLHVLIERHLDTIQKCLSPLVNEILEIDPLDTDEPEFQKLFRKISIYFILASGLGNPGHIVVSNRFNIMTLSHPCPCLVLYLGGSYIVSRQLISLTYH